MAHQLRRPAWTCSACMQPWPCPTRRDQLLDDYSGSLRELRNLMAGFISDALADLDDPAAPELEELTRQLLGWLPPRRRQPA